MKSEKIPATLILENGTAFKGFTSPKLNLPATGEVVFTTGMCGYPESMTDPSYTGQILVFTFPLIGNYGVPPQEQWESLKAHLAGVVVSESCTNWSHHSGTQSLRTWLEEQKVPIMTGVDTRALTKTLRSHGSLLGAITSEGMETPPLHDPNHEHLVAKASRGDIEVYNEGESKKIIAFDCGMKENIIRSLANFPLCIKRVPYDYDLSNEEYDGIFLSNGPGDPTQCPETLTQIQHAMKEGKPIFGICLGTQLLALAAGAKTYKLHFGHRGHNQPCMHLESKRCYITSQNHGFAVDEETLPKDWEVTFRNLNDSSVEGIAHREKPFSAVQFHPEATPGPSDTLWLFEQFYEKLGK